MLVPVSIPPCFGKSRSMDLNKSRNTIFLLCSDWLLQLSIVIGTSLHQTVSYPLIVPIISAFVWWWSVSILRWGLYWPPISCDFFFFFFSGSSFQYLYHLNIFVEPYLVQFRSLFLFPLETKSYSVAKLASCPSFPKLIFRLCASHMWSYYFK